MVCRHWTPPALMGESCGSRACREKPGPEWRPTPSASVGQGLRLAKGALRTAAQPLGKLGEAGSLFVPSLHPIITE